MVLLLLILFVMIVVACTATGRQREKQSEPEHYIKAPTYGETKSQLFDLAVENILRTKHGESFLSWRYREDRGEIKSHHTTNAVVVTLKNGTSLNEELITTEVLSSIGFGVSPEEKPEDAPEEQPQDVNPVEEWISSHAGDITTKVEKSLANNYISIIYPVESGYLSLIDDIAKLLNDRTPYEVLVENEKLKINFESLLVYEE